VAHVLTTHVLSKMDFEESLVDLRNVFQVKSDFVWKPKQIDCFRALYENKDILAVLPTGYGKSVIYQSAPFLLAARDNGVMDTNNIVLVITPLNSIMLDQIAALEKREIKACALEYKCENVVTMEGFMDEDYSINTMTCTVPLESVKSGDYNIVYAHPESLLSREGRQLIKDIKHMVCAVAVDEAHIVLEWFVLHFFLNILN